jgi:hypothetical protein
MVNSRMVNGGASRVPQPHFSGFFRVLSAISGLRNPVKYKSRFEINHKTVHPEPAPACPAQIFIV